MKNVILNFIWLIAAFCVFVMVTIILSQGTELPSWVPFDYREGPWLHALLKLFGVVVIITPFTALLGSLFSLGSERSRWALWSDNINDHWTLHLSAGMKWTMVGMAITLAGGAVFALWFQDEPIGIWLFASPLLLFSFYLGLVFLIIKVPFDQTHITAMTPFLKWETHAWADLAEIEYVPSWTEYRLHFRDGRFARVSIYFNEVDDLIEFAKAKLVEQSLPNDRKDVSV